MLSSTGMVQDNHMDRGGAVTINYDPSPRIGRDGHTAKDRLPGSALSDTICADPPTLAELDDDRLPPGVLTTYADGSVILADGKAMGAFGWIIPTANMQSEEDLMYSGGGREVMHAASLQYDRALPKHLPEGQRMSSTRM